MLLKARKLFILYRRECQLVISGAWKIWNFGRLVLLQEFELAIVDVRTLYAVLEAALTSESEIRSFVNTRCDQLPNALLTFSRILFQLEARIRCMAWVGEVLVESDDSTSGSDSKAKFVSAKKMHSLERKGPHISSDACAWLRISILLTGEIASLFELLDRHRLKYIYVDFDAALALVRYSFAELWVPLSSMVKKYCFQTGMHQIYFYFHIFKHKEFL